MRNLGCLERRLKIQVIYEYNKERSEIQEIVWEAWNRKLNKTIKKQDWGHWVVQLVEHWILGFC